MTDKHIEPQPNGDTPNGHANTNEGERKVTMSDGTKGEVCERTYLLGNTVRCNYF